MGIRSDFRAVSFIIIVVVVVIREQSADKRESIRVATSLVQNRFRSYVYCGYAVIYHAPHPRPLFIYAYKTFFKRVRCFVYHGKCGMWCIASCVPLPNTLNSNQTEIIRI